MNNNQNNKNKDGAMPDILRSKLKEAFAELTDKLNDLSIGEQFIITNDFMDILKKSIEKRIKAEFKDILKELLEEEKDENNKKTD
jgi:hypothetical protein